MKLSVIVPSIRPQNIYRLYASIRDSYSDMWQLIIIGPEEPKFEWLNTKFIKSYRSPNACQQQGLLAATGDYITFAADDGIFLLGALNKAFSLLEDDDNDINYYKKDYKTIVVGKYLEGEKPINMESDDYYRFKYHKAYQLKGVPANGLIFNCGIISRKFMLELGGWDAQNFECTTCAHADLGIRASKAGAEMILMDSPIFKCSHQPGQSGDHGPVHRAMKRDLKNFSKIYAKPNDRINIPLDNWEKTEPIWKERFK